MMNSNLYQLADYPVLAALARQHTTASELEENACVHVYGSGLHRVDWSDVSAKELALMQHLGFFPPRVDLMSLLELALAQVHEPQPSQPVHRGNWLELELANAIYEAEPDTSYSDVKTSVHAVMIRYSIRRWQDQWGAPEAVLRLVVGTLNTSTGPIVSTTHLENALRAGSLDVIDEKSAYASVSYLFVEFSMNPAIIRKCCDAVGVPISQAQKLYRQTVAEGLPRVLAWEAMSTI